MMMSSQLLCQLQLIILIIFSSILVNHIQTFDLFQLNDHTINKRAAESHPWDYNEQKEWLNLNGSICGGDRQSPINLDSSKARVDKTLTLETISYDKPVPNYSALIYSTGHSLKLNLNDLGAYSVSGSAVDNSVYLLSQVHLHWGETSMSGSEHAIDGERFAAEIHFVHVNKKYANDTNLAMENPDGLTVIGVIAKNGDPNPGLDALLEHMTTTTAHIKFRLRSDFNLKHFLPSNMKSFFKYSGSLTTPNCQEVVNWIVMKDTITVSNDQIDKLREYVDEVGNEIRTVVRDIQPPQGRTIFQSDSGSAILPTLTSLCYIMLYLIVHIILIQKSILD